MIRSPRAVARGCEDRRSLPSNDTLENLHDPQ